MNTWLPKVKKLINQNKWAEAKKILSQKGLVLMPAIIDSHVHFRTPGHTHKENWHTASKAMVNGGISAVIDMPNNSPSIIDSKTLNQKLKSVKKQIFYPIKSFFYLGASANNMPDKKLLVLRNLKGGGGKSKVIGLKVYMGSTTGSLLIDQDEYLENLFKNWTGLLAFHAEDEKLIQAREIKYKNLTSIKKHSIIRNDEVAIKSIKKLIKLSKKYNRKIYICHVSTEAEVNLIKKAKKQGIKIFAEVSPHHLFLNQADYKKWGNFIKVNPPIRTKKDNQALWKAINDGTIDVLATDHAPHLPKEKKQSYYKAPAGIPEIDTFLPLMLDAVNKKMLTANKLIELMHKNPIKIFKLKGLEKYGTIVDMKITKTVKNKNLKTKCGWSPYESKKIKGWPVATILNNKIYNIK